MIQLRASECRLHGNHRHLLCLQCLQFDICLLPRLSESKTTTTNPEKLCVVVRDRNLEPVFCLSDKLSGKMISLYIRRTSPSRLSTNFSRAMFTTTMANQSNQFLGDRTKLIPFSSRLKEGRALALDVWTIFK